MRIPPYAGSLFDCATPLLSRALYSIPSAHRSARETALACTNHPSSRPFYAHPRCSTPLHPQLRRNQRGTRRACTCASLHRCGSAPLLVGECEAAWAEIAQGSGGGRGSGTPLLFHRVARHCAVLRRRRRCCARPTGPSARPRRRCGSSRKAIGAFAHLTQAAAAAPVFRFMDRLHFKSMLPSLLPDDTRAYALQRCGDATRT